MKPLVAIIVPIFNAEKYIVRCAQSLFSQTYDAIEFIFVNDASKDKSIELLRQTLSQYPECKHQVKILEHTNNIGTAAARHSGILGSSSEYILMIDADDYIDSEMVEKLVQVAVSEQVDIVVSDIYLEYGKMTVLYKNHISNNKISNIQGLLAETTISPSLCSKLIKRSLYIHEDCTHNEKLIYHEDKYLLLKILYISNKIVQIPKAFYHYTQYNMASSTREKTEKHFNSVLLFWKLTEQFFENKKCMNDFRETINHAKIKQKAVLLISTHDTQLRKKFADMYNDLEKNYIKNLRFGEKTMLILVRLKLFNLSQILHNLLLLKNKKAFFFNKKTYYLQKQ